VTFAGQTETAEFSLFSSRERRLPLEFYLIDSVEQGKGSSMGIIAASPRR
jgi:hypothetical protein